MRRDPALPIRAAALTYAGVAAVVVAFEVALALGAPWGAYAMGGAFPGRYPPVMRVAALVQALLVALMCGVVLSRASVALAGWSGVSRRLIWLVVSLGALAVVVNLITPSRMERAIWAPVALVLLLSSTAVAVHTARDASDSG